MTDADKLAVKSELTHDPAGLGLTTLAANDEANANKLNAVYSGDPGYVKTLTVKKTSLRTSDIFNAIDPVEHQGLSTQQERWLSEMLTLGQINPSQDSGIVAGLDGMFAANSISRPAYTALLNTVGSRAQQLYQAGTLSQPYYLSPSDISDARNAS